MSSPRIPSPLSRMVIRSASRVSPLLWLRLESHASSLRIWVLTMSSPPFFIASMALRKKLRKTCSSWSESARIVSTSASQERVNLISFWYKRCPISRSDFSRTSCACSCLRIGFVPEQVGKGFPKVKVLITLRKQLREGLDRPQRVLDFVRHSRRERAETGQSIAAAYLQFQTLDRCDVRQHHQGAEHLSAFAMKDLCARAHNHVLIAHAQTDLATFLAFACSQCVAQRRPQLIREIIQRAIRHRLGIEPGDEPGLVVEDGDAFVDPGGDDAAGEIFQQRFVVNLRVLYFGEQFRVFNGDGELAAKNLERVLFGAAVNSPGKARAEQHHSLELVARKNSHHHRHIQMAHLADDAVQLGRGPNAMELIKYDRLTRSAEIGNKGVVFGKINPALARRGRMVLRVNVLLREQN